MSAVFADVPIWSGPQLAGNWDVIRYYTVQHLRYTIIAVTIGTAVALPLAYLAVRRPSTYPALLVATNVIYAIPSIALFVILGPWLGFTNDKPIVTAMVLYSLVILVRNIVEAVRSVPTAVVRAADGMGYRPLRRFVSVELPLALPGIVAGLRLATVSTVSLISVGALIGRGALGRLFSDGRARGIAVELWAGLLAVVALALVLDALLVLAGRLATPWRRTTGARSMNTILEGFGWLTTADNWWGSNGIAEALREHLWYSLLALLGAAAIGLPVGLAIGHTGRGRYVAANLTGLWRAIPTVGVVGLLFLWRPLSLWPVLVALIILAVPPIVLNTAAGIDSIPPEVRDSATGMGLTGMQSLWQVEVPNGLPLIIAGVRSAANQVIATATIAGFVGLGTLGVFIFSGTGTRRYEVVAGASIAVIALVLIVEAGFALLQRFVVSPGVRARSRGQALLL